MVTDHESGHEVEFVCADCGIDVVQFGYHDGLKVCGVCRFIRSVPNISDKMKTFLRGDSSEEVTLTKRNHD